MKRFLLWGALFLCSVLTTFAQYSGSGSGTASDPYLIFYADQLNQVRNFLNRDGVYFKLMSDIDLTDWIEQNNPSNGWQPIGVSSSAFKGIFDGNNHTISGLTINRPSTDNVGLFGYIDAATIKNLIVKGNIEGANQVGGICGAAGTATFSNCDFTQDGIFGIKSHGNNDSYLVYSSERGFNKYYDYTPIVNESYIKTVDKMKAAAEKSTYNADEIRKHAKKVIISDIIKNCDLKSIYKILLSIFRRNQHTCSAASQRVFKILSSDYINSNYFDCRLVNCFWTIDEDINNLITKTDTSVKIVLIYAGEMKIVREYDMNNMITGVNGTVYKQPVRPDSHWLNPEVEDMQADVNYLRKHLENLFPGIPFDIEVNMQYREGDGFDWTKKHVTLVRSHSDVDECIKKYKEANNL